MRSKSCASRVYGYGRSSHSVESTISRSAMPTSCSSSCALPRRLAAPAQEDRQVGDEQRLDDARGRLRARAEQPQLDHLRADVRGRRPASRSARARPSASIRSSPASGSGNEQDRARRMPLGHAGERGARLLEPRLRHPREVRHHARAQVRRPPSGADAARSFASAGSTSASVTSSPLQCSSSSGALNGAARSARRGAAGRRRSAAPTCRPRSSGSRAGRAATPRRSCRRAATAPRPRPRA